MEIRHGMYVLTQAVIMAQKQLEKRVNARGYKKSQLTLGFWTHARRIISFTLYIDNFSVKYEGKKHAQHLMVVLEEHYTISHDWKGKLYLGIDLDWDYARREVHLSILLYVK